MIVCSPPIHPKEFGVRKILLETQMALLRKSDKLGGKLWKPFFRLPHVVSVVYCFSVSFSVLLGVSYCPLVSCSAVKCLLVSFSVLQCVA